MSFLDKVGKKTLDAIEVIARAAERVRHRVVPLLEGTALGARMKARYAHEDMADVPTPEQNASPFGNNVAPEKPDKKTTETN